MSESIRHPTPFYLEQNGTQWVSEELTYRDDVNGFINSVDPWMYRNGCTNFARSRDAVSDEHHGGCESTALFIQVLHIHFCLLITKEYVPIPSLIACFYMSS